MESSRREFLRRGATMAGLAGTGLATGAVPGLASPPPDGPGGPGPGAPYPALQWPREVAEGDATPKLCQWFSRNPTEATIRRWKQAGVTHALVTDPPEPPWSEAELRADVARFEAVGMGIIGMLIPGPSTTVVLGLDGRDAEIDLIARSIRAAGAAGIPVVEYNWYHHRLSEGYYEFIDEARGGAGYTAFDYSRDVDGVPVRDLPLPEGVERYTAEQLWANLEYFLRAVVPVAEQAGVRLAVHPNDPPGVISRGNPQILGSVPDWKRLVDTVDSPANGMTVHAGVTPEVGGDAVEFLHYMGSKDRVNHIHYRNVTVDVTRERYMEVFPDNGEQDMFAFMRELIRQGYSLGVLAEHPRALDYDRENDAISGQYAEVGGGGHGGELYDTGYARAMMQASLIMERGRPGRGPRPGGGR